MKIYGLTKLTIFGMAIALGGGILIAWGDVQTSDLGCNPILGDILALIGAWMASLYLLFGTQAQKQGLSIGNYFSYPGRVVNINRCCYCCNWQTNSYQLVGAMLPLAVLRKRELPLPITDISHLQNTGNIKIYQQKNLAQLARNIRN